jgi:GH15 family glucan-1,4-alpha-glucosidase
VGKRVLPIQEDETGLVLWSLWSHFEIHRNLDFTMQLYSGLVVPAGEWMAAYVDPRNRLIKPSWDLWEERWGVHAFSVGAVWAGLRGAANFAELFGDEKSFARFSKAADELHHATDDWLWRPELDRFARRLTVAPDGAVVADNVLDSAIYGLWRFGMYEPSDPRIVKTMTAIREKLANKGRAGGVARYTNDYYFQVEHDLARTPGNPWFICTLWLAQWYIATANDVDQLRPARDIIDWVVAHKTQAGMLSEQVDPNSGAPLSVAPLTWSHAEFVVTVDDYVKKVDRLSQRRRTRKPPAVVG